jgi:hypothetical protein
MPALEVILSTHLPKNGYSWIYVSGGVKMSNNGGLKMHGINAGNMPFSFSVFKPPVL